MAVLLGGTVEEVARQAGIPVLLAPSVKAGLDVEWTDPQAPSAALQRLVGQLVALEAWVTRHVPPELAPGPLQEHLAALQQLRAQDLEPQPDGAGVHIRAGVAPDRRVSLEEPEMRHGRKSKTKRFNGYKRHIATELAEELILACALTRANRPEDEAAVELKADIERQPGGPIEELHIDRGYIKSPAVAEVLQGGGDVICRPWPVRNGQLFSKGEFSLNRRARTITCPAGVTEAFRLGTVVEFAPAVCAQCPLRAQCTTAAPGRGRPVRIGEDEPLQHRLRQRAATRPGRARLRQRVGVEHRLAHVGRRQGRRARYKGQRNNLFDLRRTAVVLNLQTIQRKTEEQELPMAA